MSGPFYRAGIPEYPGAVYGFPQTDTAELRVNGCAVPVMAEAQKTSGGTSRTYNGVLELKRAAVAGETVVEGRMLRTVETPLLAAAARTPEQDVPVLGKEQDKYGMEAKGSGGHVEVALNAGEGEALRCRSCMTGDGGPGGTDGGACGKGGGIDGGAPSGRAKPGGV